MKAKHCLMFPDHQVNIKCKGKKTGTLHSFVLLVVLIISFARKMRDWKGFLHVISNPFCQEVNKLMEIPAVYKICKG